MKRFSAWLTAAKPGDQFVYFTGNCLGGSSRGNAVRSAYNEGLIELVQRRIEHPKNENDAGVFDYIAIKRREARKPQRFFEEPKPLAA